MVKKVDEINQMKPLLVCLQKLWKEEYRVTEFYKSLDKRNIKNTA